MTEKHMINKRNYGGLDANERESARRMQLIEAGIEAFGSIGYSNTSIKMVCEAAGLTGRYFYESFDNKETFLIEVYLHLMNQLKGELLVVYNLPDISLDEKVARSLTVYFKTLRDDPYRTQVQMFEVLGVSDRVTDVYQNMIRQFSDYVNSFLQQALPKSTLKKIDTEILVHSVVGSLMRIAQDWYLSDFEKPLNILVESILNIVRTMKLNS